jgi:hypothetical protein
VLEDQIPTHRKPCMPQHIPSPEWGTRDPWARGKPRALPLSYTPDSRGFAGALAGPQMLSNPTPPWFRREGEATPCKLNNSPPPFLDLFLYLSFQPYREGGGEMVGDHVRGCRLRIGATASFIAPRCSNRGKAAGSCMHCKKVQ